MEKKPVKAKNLKVIDHLGTLYATFDGSSMWKIDRVAFGILKMCDGQRTFDQLVSDVAKKAFLEENELRPVLKQILDELTNLRFVDWI